MKLLLNTKDLKSIDSIKNSIGFVPTMGGLHKGHISLIKNSLKKCSKTLVSIFINPRQFNKRIDFKLYPRNLKKDLLILKKINPDYVYIPKYKDIFSKKRSKKIKLINFSKSLCGKYRPGHFYGVIDVVDRFLTLIKPNYIFLGQKDFQQLILIKNYILKKHKTKVVMCKTIRERNGLAFSSRNFLLNKREKIIAAKVYNYLKNKKNLFKIKKNTIKITKHLKMKLIKFGVKKIDYIKFLNLKKIDKDFNKNTNRIFVAYHLNNVRLIDNF